MQEGLEQAKRTVAQVQVEVSDLKVQINQEKALGVELKGRLAEGQC